MVLRKAWCVMVGLPVWLSLCSRVVCAETIFSADDLDADGTATNTPPAALTLPPPMDYGPGFAKLREWGLPDVLGAEYVRFTPTMSYEYERPSKLSGNAWHWPKTTNTPARVVSGNLRLLTVVESEASGGKSTASRFRFSRSGGRGAKPLKPDQTMGEVKPAQLKKDLDLLLAALARPEAERLGRRQEFSGWFDHEGKIEGVENWLFLAAHAHRVGQTNEANRLVQIVFAEQEEPKAVLVQAVNAIADSRYQQAYQAFERNGDWAAYHKAAAGLIEAYPQGWTNRPAVERLAQQLAERLSGQPAEIKGEGVTPEASAVAAALAGVKTAPHAPEAGTPAPGEKAGTPDVASTPEAEEGAGQKARNGHWIWGGEDASPMGRMSSAGERRIKALGVRAVPMLAAMLGDPWLVRDRAEGGSEIDAMMRMQMSFSSFPRSLPAGFEVPADYLYSMLARPRSRGEIAEALLNEVLAERDAERSINFSEDSGDADARHEALRERAMDWYRTFKDKPADEIAMHFLKDGNDTMRRAAGAHLVTSTNTAHQAVLESLLLEPDEYNQMDDLLDAYIQHRKEAALPLLQKIAASRGIDLNAPPKEMDSSDDYAAMKLIGYARSMKPQDFDALLAELQKEKVDKSVWQQAYPSADGQDPVAALPKVLKAAADAKSAEGRAMLLALLQPMFSSRSEEKPPPVLPAPGEYAAQWKVLLADERAARMDPGAPSITVGQSSAWMMEWLYSGPDATADSELGLDPLQMLLHVLGDPVYKVVQARAEARLAGTPAKDLPALPDAAKVTAPRAAELEAQLGAKPLTREQAAALTMDEILWIAEQLEVHDDWSALLATSAFEIVSVTLPPETPAPLAELLGPWKGQTLTRDRLEALVKLLSTPGLAGPPLEVRVERKHLLAGTEVRVTTVASPEKATGREVIINYFEQLKLQSHRMLVAQSEYRFGLWDAGLVTPGAAVPPAPEAPAADDDALPGDEVSGGEEHLEEMLKSIEENFWEQMDDSMTGGDNPLTGFTLDFYFQQAGTPAAAPATE